jgi:hypothetical protein
MKKLWTTYFLLLLTFYIAFAYSTKSNSMIDCNKGVIDLSLQNDSLFNSSPLETQNKQFVQFKGEENENSRKEKTSCPAEGSELKKHSISNYFMFFFPIFKTVP